MEESARHFHVVLGDFLQPHERGEPLPPLRQRAFEHDAALIRPTAVETRTTRWLPLPSTVQVDMAAGPCCLPARPQPFNRGVPSIFSTALPGSSTRSKWERPTRPSARIARPARLSAIALWIIWAVGVCFRMTISIFCYCVPATGFSALCSRAARPRSSLRRPTRTSRTPACAARGLDVLSRRDRDQSRRTSRLRSCACASRH